MSEAQERARALLAYATPGPWSSQREVALFPNAYVVGCPESTVIARVSRSSEQCMVAPKRARPEHDAALIAAAPGLLAALCDENDALRAEVKRLEVFEAAELQRRAILDAMNGGER